MAEHRPDFTEGCHYIQELADAIIAKLLDVPYGVPGQIQTREEVGNLLHQVQEQTLILMEDNYLTIHGLQRVLGLGDGEA